MTKQELIKKVAADTGVSQSQTGEVIDSALRNIMEAVAAGEKVQFSGFGAFEKRTRAARTGINPRTKEKIEISEMATPAFKPGKAFKDALNG